MAFRADVIKRGEGVFVVKLAGSLDTDTYRNFEEKLKPLLAPHTKSLILDMSQLEYISSSGLAVIFNARKVIEANNGIFLMTNLQPQIKKVFDVVKALPKQLIFGSMEEADKYLDAMQKKWKEEL